MCMYVCMHVCMYVHTYVCINVIQFVITHIFGHMCFCVTVFYIFCSVQVCIANTITRLDSKTAVIQYSKNDYNYTHFIV